MPNGKRYIYSNQPKEVYKLQKTWILNEDNVGRFYFCDIYLWFQRVKEMNIHVYVCWQVCVIVKICGGKILLL